MDWSVSTVLDRPALARVESFGEDEGNELDDEYNQIVGEDELKDEMKESILKADRDLVDTCLKCTAVVVVILLLALVPDSLARIGTGGNFYHPPSKSISNAHKFKEHASKLDREGGTASKSSFDKKHAMSHKPALQECQKAGGVLGSNDVACCLADCGECGGAQCDHFLDGSDEADKSKNSCCLHAVMVNGVDCKKGTAPCNVLGWAKKYNKYNEHAEQKQGASVGAKACKSLGGLIAHNVIRGHQICCPSECGVCGGAHCGYQFHESQYSCCPKRILEKSDPNHCDDYEAELPCQFA